MSTIRIATHFNIDVEFEAAPFHRRLAAWLLDVVVIVAYFYIGMEVISTLSQPDYFRDSSGEGTFAIMMILILPIITYHLLCEIFLNGQSVGKRLMKLRVINESGGRPSVSQFIIRWIIRTSDYMVIVIALSAPAIATGGLAYFWQIGAAFCLLVTDIILVNTSAKHQRLGDMLAHTLLIRTTHNADIHDTIFLDVQEDYVPSFPQVMALSDRDINSLKGILDSARKHHDYNLADRAAEKIKTHLNIQTSLSPFDFLEILLKDYNYLSAN